MAMRRLRCFEIRMTVAVCAALVLAGGSALRVRAEGEIFGSRYEVDDALVGKIYHVAPGTDRLPDFKRLTPVGTIYARTINVPRRAWDTGFPGITGRNEWFAIEYKGTFEVVESGEYEFRLTSDDGSRLFIDGTLVIDNDGTHPPRTVTRSVALDRARHTITLQYFQGPRYDIALQLFYTVAGGALQPFPGSSLRLVTDEEGSLVYWILAILVVGGILARRRWKTKRSARHRSDEIHREEEEHTKPPGAAIRCQLKPDVGHQTLPGGRPTVGPAVGLRLRHDVGVQRIEDVDPISFREDHR